MNEINGNKELSKKKKIIVLIIILVLLAVILVGGCWKKQQSSAAEVHSETEKMEIRNRLEDISGYLNQVDETILSNKETLNSMQGSETDFFKQFDVMEQEINSIKTTLNQNLKYRESIDQKTKEQMDLLLKSLSSIKDGLEQSRKQMTDELGSMENSLMHRQEKTELLISEVIEKITGVKKEVSLSQERLEAMLESLKDTNTKENLEWKDLLKKSLNLLKEWESAHYEGLNELITIENVELQFFIEDKVASLIQQLDSLHGKIEETKGNVTVLLSAMQTEAEAKQDEIISAFAQVQEMLSLIRTDYDTAQKEIKKLLEELKQTSDKNHRELIDTLGEMELIMEESSQSSMNLLMDSMEQLSQEYSVLLDSLKSEMNLNFKNMDAGVTRQLQSINSQAETRYVNLSSAVNEKNRTLREYLENEIKGINNNLKSVFTYVSNGKKLVASTLLTKGVSCREDATFAEISQAILAIPQKLVIGMEQIPGTVSYEYHYHVDSSGNPVHAEQIPVKGGCYENPVYHVHKGDSRNGGGCYTIPVTHTHTDECYTVTRTVRKVTGKWFTGQGTGHSCCTSANGQNWAKYTYVEEIYVNDELISSISGEGDLGYCCGMCFEKKAAEKGSTNTVTTITCGFLEGLNGYNLGCGMTNQTVVTYQPVCGFVDGQITGAHIKYDKPKMTSKSYIADIPELEIAPVFGNQPSFIVDESKFTGKTEQEDTTEEESESIEENEKENVEQEEKEESIESGKDAGGNPIETEGETGEKPIEPEKETEEKPVEKEEETDGKPIVPEEETEEKPTEPKKEVEEKSYAERNEEGGLNKQRNFRIKNRSELKS